MEHVLQDLRYAARQLVRRRALTFVLVLTLGLGIGANTAMLALLNALLYRPAPVPAPSELVWIASARPRSPRPSSMSYPDFQDVRDQGKAFSGTTAYTRSWVSLGGTKPQRVPALLVSGSYFDVLQVRAAQGRTFRTDEDEVPGHNPVVVISDALWRSHYGSNSRIVDSTIIVNAHQFTVIGIAPPGFEGVEIADDAPMALWIPSAMVGVVMPGEGALLTEREASWLRVVARLRPGASLQQANAQVSLIAKQIRPDKAGLRDDRTRSFVALPVNGAMDPSNRSEIAPMAPLLMLVPLLVLVVACANAANVLLARGIERRKELAMRRALGATRGRIVRQLVTESVVLGILSAAAGVVLSFWLAALIARVGAIPDAIAAMARPDWRVLVATTLLAGTAGLLFGLAPALVATRPALTPAIKDEGATFAVGRQRHRLRDLLVVGQVAVSLVLLITAALFVRSLSKMLNSDPGFEARAGTVVSYDLDLEGYDLSRRTNFERELLERVRALPGVSAAALSSAVPFGGRFNGTDVGGEGKPADLLTFLSSISPSYFETMQASLVAGREFTDRDDAAGPLVVIVNQLLAQRLWPGEDATGKRLRLFGEREPLREVVGVARDGKYANLSESATSYLFVPQLQRPATPMVLVTRSTGDPAAIVAPVTSLFRELDANLPLFNLTTLTQLIREGADKRQAAASMLGVFGALALFLAALGIYGVSAHGVTLRTREIGIRMSLGARASDVLSLFVREGLSRALVGVALGLAASAALSTLMSQFLFGLAATDALTFAAGAGVLCFVAALASYLPARRAACLDPMTALRHD